MDKVVAMILTNDDGTIVLGELSVVYVVPVEKKEEWLSTYNPTLGDGRQWIAYQAYQPVNV